MRGLLVLSLGPALGLASCFTPPAVIAPQGARVVELPAVLEAHGTGTEQVEIDGPDGRLRGIFHPADPGAPVVLHLLEAGGTVASQDYSYAPVCRQLADLGCASLILDYTGVGASDGEPSARNLPADAQAMWTEAVRRAGDPSRVIVRGISLGTIAAAWLLDAGARPGALDLVVPVRADTVTPRFARDFYGPEMSLFASVAYRDVADVDLNEVIGGLECPHLVVTAEDETLVGEDHLEELATITRRDGRFTVRRGNHYLVGIEAHALLPEERSFILDVVRPERDVVARVQAVLKDLPEELRARFPAGSDEHQALAGVAELASASDPAQVAAAALAGVDPWAATRLRWLYAIRRPKAGAPDTDGFLERLIACYDLDDPAGALPIDLIERASRVVDLPSVYGGFMAVIDAEDIAGGAAALGAGGAATWWSSGMSYGPIEVDLTFDGNVLWEALATRGLRAADLRRQYARVLLKAARVPERVRSADGVTVVEAFTEGAWEPLNLDTVRAPGSTTFSGSFRLPPSVRTPVDGSR